MSPISIQAFNLGSTWPSSELHFKVIWQKGGKKGWNTAVTGLDLLRLRIDAGWWGTAKAFSYLLALPMRH